MPVRKRKGKSGTGSGDGGDGTEKQKEKTPLKVLEFKDPNLIEPLEILQAVEKEADNLSNVIVIAIGSDNRPALFSSSMTVPEIHWQLSQALHVLMTADLNGALEDLDK